MVFMHDLADSAEVTRRVESIGEYGIHDLSMLEDGSVDGGALVVDGVCLVLENNGLERHAVAVELLDDVLDVVDDEEPLHLVQVLLLLCLGEGD